MRHTLEAGQHPITSDEVEQVDGWEYKWSVCVRYGGSCKRWFPAQEVEQTQPWCYESLSLHNTFTDDARWMKNRDQFSATKAFAVIELFKWSGPHNRYWTRWVFSAALFLPACITECTFLIRVFFPMCCVILVNLQLIIHSFSHPHTSRVSVLLCSFWEPYQSAASDSVKWIYASCLEDCHPCLKIIKHPSRKFKGPVNTFAQLAC